MELWTLLQAMGGWILRLPTQLLPSESSIMLYIVVLHRDLDSRLPSGPSATFQFSLLGIMRETDSSSDWSVTDRGPNLDWSVE